MQDIELSKRERAEYRLGLALLSLEKDDKGNRSSLAWDVSDEIRKNLPKSYNYRGGLLVPYNLPIEQRAGLDTATSTKGSELKFTTHRTFIDALRRRTVVIKGGATVLAGLQGDIADPQGAGTATASWQTQNAGSDVAESNMLFGSVPLTPKGLISTTSYSRQLLSQSVATADVDERVRIDFARIAGAGIDQAALNGSGAAGQPTGVLNRGGVQSNAFGANGAVPSWQLVTNFEKLVAVADGDADDFTPPVYITTPEVRDKCRRTDRTAGTSGWMIMDGDTDAINGYRVFASNQLPKNTTKGASGAVCHAIIFGACSEFFIGFWNALEIVSDPLRLKKQGMVELTMYQLADVNLRHVSSFAIATDVITTP